MLAPYRITGVEIRELSFEGFKQTAIQPIYAADITVTQVTVTGTTWHAIAAFYVDGFTASENVVTAQLLGILARRCEGPIIIRENDVSGITELLGIGAGIAVWSSSGEVRIEENILHDNYRGIGIEAASDGEALVVENVITGSHLVGVRLDDAPATLMENVITRTGGPGVCATVPHPTLIENEFAKNRGGDIVLDPEDGCP
jgi:parallel beta-helix repeat protein